MIDNNITRKRHELAEQVNVKLIKTRTTFDFIITESFVLSEEKRLGIKFDGIVIITGMMKYSAITNESTLDQKYLIGIFDKAKVDGKIKLKFYIRDYRQPKITQV